MRNVFTLSIVGLLICCTTIPAQGQGMICPLPPGNTLCAQLQGQQCQTTIVGLECEPTTVIFDPSAPGLVRAVACQCYDDNVCGPVTIQSDFVSCSGFCPVPPPGNECRVFVNGMPTGQTQVIFTTYPAGSQFTCECQEIDPPPCAPINNGQACPSTVCPPDPLNPGVPQICQPKCVLNGFDGSVTIVECDCGSTDKCHIDPIMGGPQQCVGTCPPGYTCFTRETATPNGILYCCECLPDPPACVPNSSHTDCVPFQCPPDGTPIVPACRPRCVRVIGPGQVEVVDCDCRGQQECHVEAPVGATPFCQGGCPPGQVCVRNEYIDDQGLLVVCCDCITPECRCPGDVDGNGILNGLDIAGFVRCFLGVPLPSDNCACVDMDGDGIYTSADITFFVQAILSKSKCFDFPCCPQSDLDLDIGSGVDDNGNLIPVGQDDDELIVIAIPPTEAGPVPRPAQVVTPHPFWNTIPGTQWLSANYFGDNGDYEYEFCFCLDDRAKNPVFTIQIRADDAGQVFLNGNPLGNAAGFSAALPATLSTNNPNHFVFGGQNCVRIAVQNIGGAPTGVNYLANITAADGACCCPTQDLAMSLNTGIDDNGNPIPNGQDDDDWVVTVDASGGSVPRPATIFTNIHPLWDTIPGTQWISADLNGPNGLYVYQYCFCLDPRFKNPVLTLDVLADDYAQLFLNGNPIGATPNGWAFQNPPTHIVVTNPDFFRACENCIEVHVVNSGGPPTGLNIGGSIVAEDGLCCDDRPKSCCLPDGNCIDLMPGVTECESGTLIDGPCGNYRPCCLPNGACEDMAVRCCELAGGTVMPSGQTCVGQQEACCVDGPSGIFCLMADPTCCVNVHGGVPQGPGTFCQGDTNGNNIDDACEPPDDQCAVNSATGLCKPTHCPIAGQECQPKCVLVASGTQQVLQVLECECMPVDRCHIQLSPAPMTASCVGTCPPGQTCQTTLVDNGNGTQTMCCVCVDDPPQVCPLGSSLGSQMCQVRQGSDCQTLPPTNTQCHPTIVIANGQGQGITVENCMCLVPGQQCRAIDIQPAASQGDYILRCLGPCGPGAGCHLFINGQPSGSFQVNTATLLPGATVTCNCYIP